MDWPYWCGRWRWIRVSSSGLTSRYSNWDKREPGGGTIENCVGLQTKGRKWHDYLCTNKFSYACKKTRKALCVRTNWFKKRNLAFSNPFFFLNWMQKYFFLLPQKPMHYFVRSHRLKLTPNIIILVFLLANSKKHGIMTFIFKIIR